MTYETVLDTRIFVEVDKDSTPIQAKTKLKQALQLEENEIEVVKPSGDNISQELEGRSKPLGKKYLNWHLIFGLLGFLAGMLVAFLLVNFGPEFTQKNPNFTYVALITPGTFIGLFFAGALSLSPQHDANNFEVMKRIKQNQNTIIIKTSWDRRNEVKDFIKSSDGLSLLQE